MDKIIRLMVRLAAFCTVLSIVLIFFFIFKEALPIFTSQEIKKDASIDQLFLPQVSPSGRYLGFRWEPVSDDPGYSIVPLFIGTLKVTIVAMLVSVPLAILAAIYIGEFAPSWIREIIKPCIEMMATIPSVIIGLLGLMVIGTFLQNVFGYEFRLNASLAGVCLSFATIPIIFTLTEDSLSAVPRSYREAALALGANQVQAIFKVVFPVATPGIFAAVTLGLGRAIGETMIVLMCSGNAPLISFNFAKPVRAMSATIAAEMPEVSVGSPHYHVLFFIGALMILLAFMTNILGQIFVERMKRKLEG